MLLPGSWDGSHEPLVSKPTGNWKAESAYVPCVAAGHGGVYWLSTALAVYLWLGLLGAGGDRPEVNRDVLRVPETSFQDFQGVAFWGRFTRVQVWVFGLNS